MQRLLISIRMKLSTVVHIRGCPFRVLFAKEQFFIFVCNVVMHIRQILRLAPFKAILPGNSAFEGPKNVETAFKVALLNVHVKHKISFY